MLGGHIPSPGRGGTEKAGSVAGLPGKMQAIHANTVMLVWQK